jgi:hypothetical protein
VLAAALAIAHPLARAIEHRAPPRLKETETFGRGRVEEATRALPRIVATPGARVLVAGTSCVMHGVSPALLDEQLLRHGVQVTSFNIGFLAFSPEMLRLMAERIREQSAVIARPIELVALQVAPHSLTVASKKDWTAKLKIAQLSSPADVAAMALHDPQEALDLTMIRWLGGYDSEQLTNMVGHMLLDESPAFWRVKPAKEPREWELNAVIFRKRTLAMGGRVPPNWDEALHGEFRWLLPETRADYAELVQIKETADSMKRHRKMMERFTDYIELHFDEGSIATFVAAAHELQRASRRLVLIVMPENPDWVHPTQAGLARWRQVLARIESETGAALIDLSDIPFESTDWLDTIHLEEQRGRAKLTAVLAERLVPYLK